MFKCHVLMQGLRFSLLSCQVTMSGWCIIAGGMTFGNRDSGIQPMPRYFNLLNNMHWFMACFAKAIFSEIY